MLSRRAAIKSLAGTFAATCFNSVAQADQFQILIDGQFNGNVRFLQVAGTQYFGDNFHTSRNPVVWRIAMGVYSRRTKDHRPIDAHGYWIYKPDANRCWKNEFGVLKYWNEDNLAKGPPEDYELFRFGVADAGAKTVIIQNLRQDGPQRYISLSGDNFSCNEPNPKLATVFFVEFV